ncbi:hypothetical protein DFQ28_000236 [Apophysomyces sp. BC1034]|nr:hypothetical protein DFQ30_001379 [Apophysomyces sp. BC1015]KAG0180978.1 hypothetical protein DFQ29_009665 [Apophysomyces sp. BC1021]KAG0191413.1 hypothetical protein DFQ28_000236 [Apophysomyces sp. BC1034]
MTTAPSSAQDNETPCTSHSRVGSPSTVSPTDTTQIERTMSNTSSSTSAHTATTPIEPSPAVTKLRAQLSKQRMVLDNMTFQKKQYQQDNDMLTEKIAKLKEKIQHRLQEKAQLEKKYNDYLQSMRATNDNLETITEKLRQLKQMISGVATDLLGHADPVTATRALCTFWLNLHEPIKKLGSPLPVDRMKMLTEKFMMDVLVQNMNLNVFPGLQVSSEYNELQSFFENHDPPFSIRLRQELALVVVSQNKPGSDVFRSLHQAVSANWKFLYGGLVKAYPYIYQHDKNEPDVRKHYGGKVQVLVEQAMSLGFAMKGQEFDIAAADTRELTQEFDPELMEDEDGQGSGVVEFCICPPFVVYTEHPRTLEKGRVLCSSNSQ